MKTTSAFFAFVIIFTAAWEQPELFVGEMRAGFKSLR